jgi:eukaryotic-like serine/threonine-protein kinase
MDFSADGEILLYMPADLADRDVIMIHVGEPDGSGERLLAGMANEQGVAISPNGRWTAYQSDESGEDEIYVRPFPDVNSGRWQISTSGGTRPLWRRDGAELFYVMEESGGGAVMAVTIDADSSFVPGTPTLLFEGDFIAPNSGRHVYDVSLDGERFLMIKRADSSETRQPQIIVVKNWFEELKRRAPSK